MGDPIRNILFLCTGNSARSIIAEALANSLPICREKFHAYSAGSNPTGKVNSYALEWLRNNGVATEGLRSKSWKEFDGPNAPVMHFVFTVCDSAANEVCPIWPGHPVTAHWGVPDPAAVEGNDDDKRKAFKNTAVVLARRIELLANLPLDKLDHLVLQQHINDIGRR